MSLTNHDTAAELSATAADIAAAIADGRTPARADLEHARDMLDTLEAVFGHPASRPVVEPPGETPATAPLFEAEPYRVAAPAAASEH